jgi:hypothetical protein
MTSDELSQRLIDFAARIGKVVDALPDTRMGRHVAGQFSIFTFQFSLSFVVTLSQQPFWFAVRAASSTS